MWITPVARVSPSVRVAVFWLQDRGERCERQSRADENLRACARGSPALWLPLTLDWAPALILRQSRKQSPLGRVLPEPQTPRSHSCTEKEQPAGALGGGASTQIPACHHPHHLRKLVDPALGPGTVGSPHKVTVEMRGKTT